VIENKMPSDTIILVEDNPGDEALTLRALKKTNIANDIVVARDGVEALDYLFGTGQYEGSGIQKPAVVMLDIKLPKINGLEVLERLRSDERTSRIPVVILSSSDEECDIVKSYDLGVNSYVCKPIEFSEFSRVVAEMGRYWLLQNKRPSERN